MRNFILPISLFLLACGSSTQESSDTTSGTSTSASSGSGDASSSASASSGSSTSSATSSASSTGAGGAGGAGGGGSGGSGGSGGCNGHIDITVDNGALETYKSICSNSWGGNENMTAVAYESFGPGPGKMSLVIDGCVSSQANAEGVTISADNVNGLGMFKGVTTTWIDKNGMSWGVPGDQVTLTVTKLDPAGGVVEGSFNGFVSKGGQIAHQLDATFHVCRVSDQLLP